MAHYNSVTQPQASATVTSLWLHAICTNAALEALFDQGHRNTSALHVHVRHTHLGLDLALCRRCWFIPGDPLLVQLLASSASAASVSPA
jgi:hypothetical protein